MRHDLIVDLNDVGVLVETLTVSRIRLCGIGRRDEIEYEDGHIALVNRLDLLGVVAVEGHGITLNALDVGYAVEDSDLEAKEVYYRYGGDIYCKDYKYYCLFHYCFSL